jgi:hypothetical protein
MQAEITRHLKRCVDYYDHQLDMKEPLGMKSSEYSEKRPIIVLPQDSLLLTTTVLKSKKASLNDCITDSA